MHVTRVLAALGLGAVADRLIAPPIADALLFRVGPAGALYAALITPALIIAAAALVVALTCPLKAVK